MSFRRRVVLLAAGAVAAAIVIASVVVYVVTGNELHARIDATLRQKLTPGRTQAVQIKTVNVSAAELPKLVREGKLTPGASPAGFGQSVVRLSLPRGAAVKAQPCVQAVLHSIETAYVGQILRFAPPGANRPARAPPPLALRRSPQPARAAPSDSRQRGRLRAAVPGQRAGPALGNQGTATSGHGRHPRGGGGPARRLLQ